jgi:hypothetical protein
MVNNDPIKHDKSQETILKYDDSALDNLKKTVIPEEDNLRISEEKPAATMYGYPAKMVSKITPLNKKGKMSPCYKTGGPYEGEFKLPEGESATGFEKSKKGLGGFGNRVKHALDKFKQKSSGNDFNRHVSQKL